MLRCIVAHGSDLGWDGTMRSLTTLAVVLATAVASCSPDQDVTGTANSCATGLYTNYDAKKLDQCTDVCIKCNKGTVTTCSTSCGLKGAR